MTEQVEQVPTASAFKPDFMIRIQKSRDSEEFIEIGLKDIDEQTYLVAQALIRKDKELEAVRFILKNLRVSGATAEEITNDFRRTQAAFSPILDFLTPLNAELKKN